MFVVLSAQEINFYNKSIALFFNDFESTDSIRIKFTHLLLLFHFQIFKKYNIKITPESEHRNVKNKSDTEEHF